MSHFDDERPEHERSRVDTGGCTWHESRPYVNERTKLESERNPATPDDEDPWDFTVLDYLTELIELIQGNGVAPGSYFAPMGEREAVAMNPKPWMGEFKVTGIARKQEGGKRKYRLYFAEPDMDTKAVLGAHLSHKKANHLKGTVAGTKVPLTSAGQTSEVVAAMGIVKRWCKQSNVGFRTHP
ncbi:hypothetical protein [Tsukamurella sp. NPDC003166]|uniref:hypothetical protein n=1 Tax=Tsukamurella sp. NPDC003166 TaxID=3154444 RepID=UPI0033BA2C3F